jgi:hypothetical protein
MAVRIEVLAIVIRRTAIDERYRGGWPAFISRWGGAVGRTAWFDDQPFCINTMDPNADADVAEMRAGGLLPFHEADGETVWLDLCVLDIMGWHGVCSWLEQSPDRHAVHLKGVAAGQVADRSNPRAGSEDITGAGPRPVVVEPRTTVR